MTPSKIELSLVDYHNTEQAKAIGYLLNLYACDLAGGGEALEEGMPEKLAQALVTIPHAMSIIAYVNHEPAGLLNGFYGFSTFKCKPLLNIHDLVVIPGYRRLGLCHRLLEKAELLAREKDCCKMTLEVLENNRPAKAAYQSFGFSSYERNPAMGQAVFWQKPLGAL